MKSRLDSYIPPDFKKANEFNNEFQAMYENNEVDFYTFWDYVTRVYYAERHRSLTDITLTYAEKYNYFRDKQNYINTMLMYLSVIMLPLNVFSTVVFERVLRRFFKKFDWNI